ncbi:hypothetical protein BGZ61DRAFT_129409 [Ilyonectria robusta]|uniref:uncharacterized protein n=1 Tax=Ilyonectria robusta TaxID=1079257 RepID=UPI001E8ECB4A|nr:uncharacterized protein BGZ61DRAFT_129409 [Ilyonectria robusta]KAH8734766.1 hypothetical protein BGZ61DRAFT_129409 [Ilyonectria robusta]
MWQSSNCIGEAQGPHCESHGREGGWQRASRLRDSDLRPQNDNNGNDKRQCAKSRCTWANNIARRRCRSTTAEKGKEKRQGRKQSAREILEAEEMKEGRCMTPSKPGWEREETSSETG